VGIYSRGSLIQTTGAGAACLEFNFNNTERAYLLKVRITLETAPGAASVFGIGSATNPGQGSTWLTSSPEDAGGLADNFPNIATAWTGTPPTAPAQFYRRSTIDNVVGSEIEWLFPFGLVMPNTSSFVIWNITAVGASEITLTWDN